MAKVKEPWGGCWWREVDKYVSVLTDWLVLHISDDLIGTGDRGEEIGQKILQETSIGIVVVCLAHAIYLFFI